MQLLSPTAQELNRYLDLSALQLKVTAQNMANVDTPGYRTVGFDFARAMERSVAALQGAPAGVAASESPALAPVGGLLERPDGNDVSIDREGLQMAEAQLQFRTGAALLEHQFTRVMDAIHADEK